MQKMDEFSESTNQEVEDNEKPPFNFNEYEIRYQKTEEFVKKFANQSLPTRLEFLANLTGELKRHENEASPKQLNKYEIDVKKGFYNVLSLGATGGKNTLVGNEVGTEGMMAVELEHPYLPHRSIIHLDVDCFECQVWLSEYDEAWAKRPCVTVNPPLRITAVNYPAREAGIKRSMNLADAKKLCKDLTIFANDAHSLDPWARHRDVSNSVLKSIQNVIRKYNFENVVIDQASKDEFYIEVTEEVISNYFQEAWWRQKLYSDKGIKVVIEDEVGSIRLDKNYEEKWLDIEEQTRLIGGGAIAKLFCDAIKTDTNIECSAGVGENKLMARLCCGMNKPHSVSILTHNGYFRVAQTTDLDKLAGLGGVLGLKIKDDLGINTIAELKTLDPDELDEKIGHRIGYGKKLHSWADGIHYEAVKENLVPPSVTTAKSFSILHNPVEIETLRSELWILAHRLAARLDEDLKTYHRLPIKGKIEISTTNFGHFSFELLPASWIRINGELIFGIIDNILENHFQNNQKLNTKGKIYLDEIRLSVRHFVTAIRFPISENSKKCYWEYYRSMGLGFTGIIEEQGLVFKEAINKELAQQCVGKLYQMKYGQENRDPKQKVLIKDTVKAPTGKQLQKKVAELNFKYNRPVSSTTIQKLAYDKLYAEPKPIDELKTPKSPDSSLDLEPDDIRYDGFVFLNFVSQLKVKFMKELEEMPKPVTEEQIVFAKMSATHNATSGLSHGLEIVPPARPTPENHNFLQYLHGTDKSNLEIGKKNHPLAYRNCQPEFWDKKIYDQKENLPAKPVQTPPEEFPVELYHGDFKTIAAKAEYAKFGPKQRYGQKGNTRGAGGHIPTITKKVSTPGDDVACQKSLVIIREVRGVDDDDQNQIDQCLPDKTRSEENTNQNGHEPKSLDEHGLAAAGDSEEKLIKDNELSNTVSRIKSKNDTFDHAEDPESEAKIVDVDKSKICDYTDVFNAGSDAQMEATNGPICDNAETLNDLGVGSKKLEPASGLESKIYVEYPIDSNCCVAKAMSGHESKNVDHSDDAGSDAEATNGYTFKNDVDNPSGLGTSSEAKNKDVQSRQQALRRKKRGGRRGRNNKYKYSKLAKQPEDHAQ